MGAMSTTQGLSIGRVMGVVRMKQILHTKRQEDIKKNKATIDALSTSISLSTSSRGVSGSWGRRDPAASLDQPILPDQDKKEKASNFVGLLGILFDPICLLLIFWPLGLAAHYCKWGDKLGFLFNFLAMVPLAKLLGDATEELAAGLHNDTVGGLLNATFGNAVEMILTISTLKASQADPTMINVVKGTLLGSVLSNLLLVLGSSFILGGLQPVPKVQKEETGEDCITASLQDQARGAANESPVELTRKGKVQQFNTEAALTSMTMLLLATASFAFPTVFIAGHDGPENSDLALKVSRWCSIYILISYICFLAFQLYTHIDMFSGDDDEEGGEDPAITPLVAFVMLFVVTLFVAASSEWLVDSIDGLVEDLKGTSFEMSKTFIGIILLPIVGNACEHVGAIRMAMVEKVDITIGIAVGSSTQIALFVVPFAVLAGWVMGVPMDLNFGSLNCTVMLFAVLIAFSIVTDGRANWLEGVMLVVAYAVVATLYFFFPDGSSATAATLYRNEF